jgi:hypothetical protein
LGLIPGIPQIELSEGYSIGNVNKEYGTFDVFYGEWRIGRVTSHGYYYATYRPGEKDYSDIRVSEYVKGEHAQRKCAEIIVAFHKLIGTINLEHSVSFHPNATMTTFTMGSYYISTVFGYIHFANVHRRADGWHVEQLYGLLEATVYQTPQEAADAAYTAARKKGETVSTIDREMVKAGWCKDRKEAGEQVGEWRDWKYNPVDVNGQEFDKYKIERKANPGDVIKWRGKTWTVS